MIGKTGRNIPFQHDEAAPWVLLRHVLLMLIVAPSILCSQEVQFSQPGGFYENTFSLKLTCQLSETTIHYTTNGNAPTVNSPTYTIPLLLNQDLYSRSDIYTIQNSPENDWFCPESVQHCIVIRAAAFDVAGNQVTPLVTNSYFIHTLGCDTHKLPVVSICADSLDLFDYERGILVPGVYYDSTIFYSGNYYQTGIGWERECNVEFYERDSEGINQRAGLRTHGLSTRRFPQKGLKIYARKEYGKKRFNYKFFDNIDVQSFKHLKIKPFKSGWEGIGCEDYICGRVVEKLDVDALASRPVVLFLNGEYWGIYYL